MFTLINIRLFSLYSSTRILLYYVYTHSYTIILCIYTLIYTCMPIDHITLLYLTVNHHIIYNHYYIHLYISILARSTLATYLSNIIKP